MILIDRAENGYLLYERNDYDTDWLPPTVYQTRDALGDADMDARIELLWDVIYHMGWNESRSAEWRIVIDKEHGDKWLSPEELSLVNPSPEDAGA